MTSTRLNYLFCFSINCRNERLISSSISRCSANSSLRLVTSRFISSWFCCEDTDILDRADNDGRLGSIFSSYSFSKSFCFSPCAAFPLNSSGSDSDCRPASQCRFLLHESDPRSWGCGSRRERGCRSGSGNAWTFSVFWKAPWWRRGSTSSSCASKHRLFRVT